jgi:hypothetical protein
MRRPERIHVAVSLGTWFSERHEDYQIGRNLNANCGSIATLKRHAIGHRWHQIGMRTPTATELTYAQ